MTTATLDDLLALNDEIAALVRAGLPLEEGLAELGGDMPGRLGRIATSLSEAASRGEPLEQALLDRAVALPPVYRAVMQAGMRAGRLPAALEAVATSARRITETRRAAVIAVSYPLLVSALVWCGLAVFTRTLAPSLARSFHSLDVPGERFFAALEPDRPLGVVLGARVSRGRRAAGRGMVVSLHAGNHDRGRCRKRGQVQFVRSTRRAVPGKLDLSPFPAPPIGSSAGCRGWGGCFAGRGRPPSLKSSPCWSKTTRPCTKR